MTPKTYGHERKGNTVRVTDQSMPRGMRRVDPECDVHTFKEGPIARLFSRR